LSRAKALRTLRSELAVTRARLAGFQDHEKQLVDLIESLEASR